MSESESERKKQASKDMNELFSCNLSHSPMPRSTKLTCGVARISFRGQACSVVVLSLFLVVHAHYMSGKDRPETAQGGGPGRGGCVLASFCSLLSMGRLCSAHYPAISKKVLSR